MTKAKNDYVMTGRPKKRLFIGMLSLTAVLMAAILVFQYLAAKKEKPQVA